MKTIWILVADSSRAKIFQAHGAMRGVHEIETFSNPEGRAHNRDLKTDGSGRYFGKGEHNQAIPPHRKSSRPSTRPSCSPSASTTIWKRRASTIASTACI